MTVRGIGRNDALNTLCTWVQICAVPRKPVKWCRMQSSRGPVAKAKAWCTASENWRAYHIMITILMRG
jgi:hypothetical protein